MEILNQVKPSKKEEVGRKRTLYLNAFEGVPVNVVEEIKSHGYELGLIDPRLGIPNSLVKDTLDLGFYSDYRFLGMARNEYVEQLTGVEQPRKYNVSQALELSAPVVVKNLYMDRGGEFSYSMDSAV